ncbi:hypothetical protein HanPI659440_Chr10g0388791 [Helianthus annuus]|nr:hypothetical protein HanPI659440_Chr10g0388791 [Helianthus annuus]
MMFGERRRMFQVVAGECGEVGDSSRHGGDIEKKNSADVRITSAGLTIRIGCEVCATFVEPTSAAEKVPWMVYWCVVGPAMDFFFTTGHYKVSPIDMSPVR